MILAAKEAKLRRTAHRMGLILKSHSRTADDPFPFSLSIDEAERSIGG